ncbi:hypothetical protein AB0J80_20975 [Actinoplanes sp. NPDC049548]|uniref:hypothetical protein n=1 Tax=Actinoplanes sp. NPDC049548 TaxID=3155152 RepID=UPI003440870B
MIVLLSRYDNDAVTADVAGIMIDVEAVGVDRGSIVLRLHAEDVRSVLRRAASIIESDAED